MKTPPSLWVCRIRWALHKLACFHFRVHAGPTWTMCIRCERVWNQSVDELGLR